MDTSFSSCDESPIHHGSPMHLSPAANLVLKAPALTPATVASSPSHSTYSSTTAASPVSHSFQRLRVPQPTPCRPCLDPRYAARLVKPQANEAAELMPPPKVQRYDTQNQASIFRPSPIMVPLSFGPGRQQSSSSSSVSSESGTPHRPQTKRTKSDFSTGDRFIPSRAASNLSFDLWEGLAQQKPSRCNKSKSSAGETESSEHSNSSSGNQDSSSSGDNASNSAEANYARTFTATAQRNLLSTLMRTEVLGRNENAPTRATSHDRSQFRFDAIQNADENFLDPTSIVNSFNLTPACSPSSVRLIAAPSKRKRRISKVPFKVLDAPALQDDFYLNLVDWSSQNVLAVGLGACVYLWSACTSKVTKLCDLSSSEDTVTAVSWAQRGTHLSVGTNKGEVQLWDTIKCKKVRSMSGHSARVGTLAWTGPILASGSRDRLIYLRDVRVQAPFTDKLSNHRQEVCGLRWSFEEPAFLASGGNDNNLHVIDSRNPSEPLHKFTEHTAAVKAIAWSPHQHGLLASGGGTADRCIRFWNTLSGASLNKVDTGSQVCNLAWSQNCNEIVSTHGYSLNQIVVWRYPSMSKVTTLTGHTFRVLYLAMSPDGSTVVTGAGDETLRFWQIFPGPRSDGKDSAGGLLFPNTLGSVIR